VTGEPVLIAAADPDHPHARRCLAAYVAELALRFDGGFDPGHSIPATADDLRPPQGLLLLATRGGEPVACGALKLHGDEPTELKRMWVAPEARGLGMGRRMLAALEEAALARSTSRIIRLETNRALAPAIALYRSAGYVEVAAFNAEPYAHHWFEKRLV
jgi:GNAT superfamily N-acetyltransferase